MPKMTKSQLKNNQIIMDLVHSDKPLTLDERLFILEKYTPDSQQVTKNKAFFTPMDLANEASIYMPNGGIVADLGAGIGRLTHFALQDASEVIAVEIDPAFVEIGKRVCPEATWIQGDLFSLDLSFDSFVSNPPFFRKSRPGYKTEDMSLQIVEYGMARSDYGLVILPQSMCPFKYSGMSQYTLQEPNSVGQNFINAYPQVQWYPSSSDTTFVSSFLDTGITVEICTFSLF